MTDIWYNTFIEHRLKFIKYDQKYYIRWHYVKKRKHHFFIWGHILKTS